MSGGFLERSPTCLFHLAFEPDPRNIAVLEVRGAHLANVEIVRMAISNRTREQTFFFSDLTEANSLNEEMLKLPGIGWSLTDQRQVTCVTIDDFCAIEHGVHVDFIKMDIEGAEDFVWEGAHITLAKGVRIVMELHRTPDAAKLQALFESYGYKFEGEPGADPGRMENGRHYYLSRP